MHDNDKAEALLFQQQQQQQQRHIFRTSYSICFIHKTVSLWNGDSYLSMNSNRPNRYFLCQMRKWAVDISSSGSKRSLATRILIHASLETVYLKTPSVRRFSRASCSEGHYINVRIQYYNKTFTHISA